MVRHHRRCCAFHQCGQNGSRRNDGIVDRCEDKSLRFTLLNPHVFAHKNIKT